VKIRLVGGQSHNRQVDWDLKQGSAIQCPYREPTSDPLWPEYGVQTYTIRKFASEQMTDRFTVRQRLWYAAVLSSMTDNQAVQYRDLLTRDPAHQTEYRDPTPAEQAEWDARRHNN